MRRTAFALVMMISFVSVVNGFWWDSPETKAKKRVIRLEKYALKAANTEALRALGWSFKYRKLTNEIINSGSSIVPYFKGALLDRKKDWRARFLCVDQIIIVKDIEQNDAKEITSALLEILNDSNDNREVRREIANNFYWIGGRSSKMGETELPTGHWANLLSFDDRKQIVQTLIKIGRSRNQDNQVRWNSIRSLSVFSDFETAIIDSIECCIDDPDQHIRAITTNTLGAIANQEKKRVGQILVYILSTKGNQDLSTEQALFWIKQLQITEAKPYLLESLKTGRYCAKSSAAEILGILRDKDAVPHLIKNAQNAEDALLAYEAIIALGRIGDSRAYEILIEIAIGDRSTNDDAARALGYLGDKRAIPSLLELLDDDSVCINLKEAASVALLRLDSQEAIPFIEKAISDGKSVNPRVWNNIENILRKYKRGEDIDWSKDDSAP